MSEHTKTGGLVERLRERAESYRMGGPSSDHTATLLDEAATALASERAAHAETKRERDEAMNALEQIAAIEPVSNCDAGSMARSRMRDIARYSIARMPK